LTKDSNVAGGVGSIVNVYVVGDVADELHDQGCGDSAAEAMRRGVVGFEVDLRCLLAAVDRGDAASIAGWFELGHGPLGQVAALA
jgi:hypothetical protein